MPPRVPRSSTVETPASLAKAMVSAIAGSGRAIWIDPCTGNGAFIAALRQAGIPKHRVRAIDLSRRRGDHDQHARVERGVDFLEWARHHVGTCDRLIMNPPYVSLNRLHGGPRRAALDVALPEGDHLHLTANYWCAFILRAIETLRPGGSLVAVLPASWDYASYARPVRAAVGAAFATVTEIRSATPLFPKVLEGAVVVVATNKGGTSAGWERIEAPDAAGTTQALEALSQRSRRGASPKVTTLAVDKHPTVALGELMNVRIGAVTGDAHYFLLSEKERVQYDLPRSSLKPVVTRARHLCGAFITRAHWLRLLEKGERVWLFRPQRGVKPAAVRRYLERGKRGSCNLKAYKVSRRDVWYQVPLPSRPDGFISGMGKGMPFLALRAMRGLTATNTLYIVQFHRHVSSPEGRASAALAMLTTAARAELQRHARIYADGLLKFEPAELSRVRVPRWRSTRGATGALRTAMAFLEAGDARSARAIADQWFAAQVRKSPEPSRGATHLRPGLAAR
jgi:adenine-specific DNA-methyltransferase